MDNVNKAPNNWDIQEHHPKIKPIPEGAKLGADIPLAMTLHRAYKYKLTNPSPAPKPKERIEITPAPVARMRNSSEPIVYEEMSYKVTSIPIPPSNLAASQLDGMITANLTKRVIDHMPLFEDVEKAVYPYREKLRGDSREKSRVAVPPRAYSQGQARPYHCDQAANPEGPKPSPIYMKKVN